jgi:hypothetical protein
MAKPKKPSAASNAAEYVDKTRSWEDRSDPKRLRAWSSDGIFILDAGLDDGKLHGAVHWLKNASDDAAVLQRETYAFPHNEAIYEMEAKYDHGELRRAVFFQLYPARELALSTSWQNGELHGPAQWFVHRTGSDFSQPLLRYNDVEVTSKTFKLPKPWPERIDAMFAKGKISSAEYFEKNGKRRGPPPAAIADWGQNAKSIDGYVSKRLAIDLTAFFPDKSKVKAKPKRASKTWLANLKAEHRDAAAAFAKIVESGAFPFLGVAMDVNTFGFDTADLRGDAANPRYVGLSSDGSGNMHLLDLETGNVVGYEHESDAIDPKRTFDSIDAYAFALLRIELALDKRIEAAELTKALDRLGLKAAKHELKLALSGG